MKVITILSLLLLLVSPAFGELTKEDIRTIFKEEVTASEKRTREYIDLKFEATNARIEALDQKIDGVEKSLNARIDGVDKSLNARIGALDKSLNAKIGALDKSLNARIDDVRIIMIALISLVVAAIAVPQIIIAYKEKGQKEMQTEIQQLREKIETLENTLS